LISQTTYRRKESHEGSPLRGFYLVLFIVFNIRSTLLKRNDKAKYN